MEVKVKYLVLAAVLYMYVPVVIFLFGWLKPAVASAAFAVVIAALFLGLSSWFKEPEEREETINVSGGMLAAAAIFILFICFNTGIGAFTGQAGDWAKHNAVLRDIIERE